MSTISNAPDQPPIIPHERKSEPLPQKDRARRDVSSESEDDDKISQVAKHTLEQQSKEKPTEESDEENSEIKKAVAEFQELSKQKEELLKSPHQNQGGLKSIDAKLQKAANKFHQLLKQEKQSADPKSVPLPSQLPRKLHDLPERPELESSHTGFAPRPLGDLGQEDATHPDEPPSKAESHGEDISDLEQEVQKGFTKKMEEFAEENAFIEDSDPQRVSVKSTRLDVGPEEYLAQGTLDEEKIAYAKKQLEALEVSKEEAIQYLPKKLRKGRKVANIKEELAAAFKAIEEGKRVVVSKDGTLVPKKKGIMPWKRRRLGPKAMKAMFERVETIRGLGGDHLDEYNRLEKLVEERPRLSKKYEKMKAEAIEKRRVATKERLETLNTKWGNFYGVEAKHPMPRDLLWKFTDDEKELQNLKKEIQELRGRGRDADLKELDEGIEKASEYLQNFRIRQDQEEAVELESDDVEFSSVQDESLGVEDAGDVISREQLLKELLKEVGIEEEPVFEKELQNLKKEIQELRGRGRDKLKQEIDLGELTRDYGPQPAVTSAKRERKEGVRSEDDVAKTEGGEGIVASSATEEERKNTLGRVRQEILNTEITYNEKLVSLIDKLKKDEKLEGKFTSDIKYLEELKASSDQIIQEVRVCVDTKDDQKLAALFSSAEKESAVTKYFESYQQYASEYKNFIDRLRKLKFEKADAQKLENEAITPVQRGPRYELLLREVIKNADEKDKENFEKALSNVVQQNRMVEGKKLQRELNMALKSMKENKKVIVDHGEFKVKRSSLLKKHTLNPEAVKLMLEHIRKIQESGIDCSAEIKQLQDNASFQKLIDKDKNLKSQFQGLS